MSTALTLQSLPLFPLSTVLFPDGVLPLRIFEVRYLDMIGRCHKAGAPFGVVALIWRARYVEGRLPFKIPVAITRTSLPWLRAAARIAS